MIAHRAWTAIDAGVVADRAHVAHMVRKTLQLGHDATQHVGAHRDIPAQRIFHGSRERETIGDRAVPRDARGDFPCLLDRSAPAERLYALVHIAEPLFEASDCLAVGCKPKMSWLNNAGVNRAYRNLMQADAFDRKKSIALFLLAGRLGQTPWSSQARSSGRPIGFVP